MTKLEHKVVAVHIPTDGKADWAELIKALDEGWEVYESDYAEHHFHYILRRIT